MRAGFVRRLRDPEVEDLEQRSPVLPLREEEVRWLEIPMHDPERVRLRDTGACLQNVFDSIADRQRTMVTEHVREVAPGQVLHDEIGRAGRERPDVADVSDVLGLDPHRRSRLADEAPDGLGITRAARQEALHGVLLVELQMPHGDDDAHSSESEDPLDAVLVGDDLADLRDRGRVSLVRARALPVLSLVGVLGHATMITTAYSRREPVARYPAATMPVTRDSFCSFCGTAYETPLRYPRTCTGCKTQIWANPIPVSVVLVPVLRDGRTGLLVVRRAIEPRKDKLALVGGFLEEHETWAVGGAREILEETGVVVDAATLTPFWFTSTQPRPNRVLLFSTATPIDASALGTAVQNAETSERGLVFGPGGLDDVFAFPLHVEAARRFFAERGLTGDHAYVQA
jgi:ADP-ribose pyrophosphatase YjhB (NUDIX family)